MKTIHVLSIKLQQQLVIKINYLQLVNMKYLYLTKTMLFIFYHYHNKIYIYSISIILCFYSIDYYKIF